VVSYGTGTQPAQAAVRVKVLSKDSEALEVPDT